MKTIVTLLLTLLVLSLVLVSCGTKDMTGPKTTDQTVTTIKASVDNPDTYPIYAGNESIHVGDMYVWNDVDYIYVKFMMIDGWKTTEYQVHVAATVDQVPGYPTPIPGHFTYKRDYDPAITQDTYQIPRVNEPHWTFVCDQTIAIVAHLVVEHDNYQGGGYQEETAFGGDNPGPGPRWWWYMQYTITCNGNGGGGENQFETAMVRMYDLPNDFTYRWKMANNRWHPWFSYVKVTPTMTPQTFYWYAGQTDKCGEVQIWKDGDFLKIQIDTINDWKMTATHVKVALTDYKEVPAFGRFPYKDYYDPAAITDTYEIPWDSAWDGQLLRIAVHGDVQKIIED